MDSACVGFSRRRIGQPGQGLSACSPYGAQLEQRVDRVVAAVAQGSEHSGCRIQRMRRRQPRFESRQRTRRAQRPSAA
eukprot:3677237-Prymnesium_polylepis.1